VFLWRGQLRHRRQAPVTPPTAEEITGIAVALLAGSEILSLAPGIRANGWIQLLIGALQGIAAAGEQNKRRGRGRR